MSWLVTESHLMKSLWRPLKKKSSRTNSSLTISSSSSSSSIGGELAVHMQYSRQYATIARCDGLFHVRFATRVLCVRQRLLTATIHSKFFLLLFSLKALERLFIVLFALFLWFHSNNLNGIWIGSEWHRQRFVVIITSFWPSTCERRERSYTPTESLWWCELYATTTHTRRKRGSNTHFAESVKCDVVCRRRLYRRDWRFVYARMRWGEREKARYVVCTEKQHRISCQRCVIWIGCVLRPPVLVSLNSTTC